VLIVATISKNFSINLAKMGGYSKLACFMAEKNHAIFRQFHHLAIRDLLYMQAELAHLAHEYDNASEADQVAGEQDQDERQHYRREWWHLSNSEKRGFGGQQWEIALQIRSKLKEYCMLISSFDSNQHLWLIA